MRIAEITRKTAETDISVKINIDGTGISNVSTKIGFFDHMLTAFAKHASVDLDINISGDLEVDGHHSVEDAGIVIGQVIAKCFEDKSKIARYGTAFIPMDESLAFCTLDISERPYLVFDCKFNSDKIGSLDSQLVEEFFRALAFNAKITLHLKLEYGTNDHHKCEALFKAFAHAIRIAKMETNETILSTKGVL